MILRRIVSADVQAIYVMLNRENIPADEMRFWRGDTWVLADENDEAIGFFTWEFVTGFPYLAHFCVRSDRRSTKTARLLARLMLDFFRKLEVTRLVTGVKKQNIRLQNVVMYFFHAQPYAEQDGQIYFDLEVSHGRRRNTAHAPADVGG